MTFLANREPVIERLVDRSILPIAPMVIFFLPMVDTLSIYIYRVVKGGSPFTPDRLHLHHMLLKILRSHKLTSFSLMFICILNISLFSYLAFHMTSFNFQLLFFALFFVCVITLTGVRQLKKKYFTI